MTEIKQRSLEEVKALSVEEAVEIMRQAGIVGAGGGGFPTYFKYKAPQPHLIVNATESEPGYWGDKLVHKEYLEEFLQLFEAMKSIFGFEQISLGVHEKDREWYAEYQEHAGDVYDVRYVPDTYALGEEKTLVKHATESRVPRFVDNPDGTRRPGMPPDVGKVVNNSETLLNIYNALFLGKPTTTKFFTLYGEEVDIKVYEAPIGASVSEILGIAGLDVENSSHLSVIDGGPYLHDMAIEKLGTGHDAYVRRMTNALFLLPEGRQGKEYADIETEPPEEGIVSLVGEISGVHLPLGGGLLTPATPLVSEDDEVEYEQKIGEPADEGFSIGVWASAGGEITSIENGIVAIAGGAIPQEEAEAEAEASTAGGAPPRGEAEPFHEAESTR